MKQSSQGCSDRLFTKQVEPRMLKLPKPALAAMGPILFSWFQKNLPNVSIHVDKD